MPKKIRLLIVDGQQDFSIERDPQNPSKRYGALSVAGGEEAMERTAAMIRRAPEKFDSIHPTMDSHHVNHIAHCGLWMDKYGNHPPIYTVISASDVENGVWGPINPGWRGIFLDYVRQLEKNGRYMLCIWPVHCVIGTWGHAFHPTLADALYEWEDSQKKNLDIVTKGSNWKTEHYSAIQADVPDPNDPTTQFNTNFVQVLQTADIIPITGIALSHCVCNTVTDAADKFDPANIKKFVLLTDTCPSVGGYEHLGEKFIKDMVARGMQLSTSVDFLA
jgi:nicotinamidase-related amidase